MIPEGIDFFCEKPHPQSAVYLAAWIMDSCDELNLNNTKKDASIERHSFTHAQKMRAAATFGFGRVHGLGMQAWHRSETTGKMLGNPSVSETLTSYMLSLRRRKTQIGETATSARAATSDLLSKLFHFNNQPQFREPQPFQSTARNTPKNSQDWAGARARSLLDLGYSLAFCGLLRVDELLKIQLHDIEFEEINGRWKLTLQLPFRKTSQFGAIKPFIWWMMPEEYSHLCVVRAFARWIMVSDITNGYLFRKIRANDRIAEENEPMTSEQFLEMFRNNLIDIGVDHIPYGTHSFRRGGCQWLSVERRWPLRQIFDRDDFFNLNRPSAFVCPACNRSCHCA
ncbi:DNA breaking-rejoining enzyme [Lentinula edodes]|nr:DNA breaking-rejoining enzyme [Lentinula edodes]